MVRIFTGFFTYGGILEACHDSLMRELLLATTLKDVEMVVHRVSDDALISRSRSRAASRFLEASATPPPSVAFSGKGHSEAPIPFDVLFMLDHDMAFRSGDLLATCQKAMETKGIVGGLYSNRAFAQGFTSRLKDEAVPITIGEDQILPAQYVATGFMAIHRSVLEKMLGYTKGDVAGLPVRRCAEFIKPDGSCRTFYNFFDCITVVSDMVKQDKDGVIYEALSEDWSFSRKAQAVGVPLHVYAKPVLVHHGLHGYTQQDGMRPRR